jgi:hypothetical protein
MVSKYARGFVTWNGQQREVMKYRDYWPAIQHTHQVEAFFEDITYSFTVTQGKGQGITDNAYAYFTNQDDELCYFSTGTELLPAGAKVAWV